MFLLIQLYLLHPIHIKYKQLVGCVLKKVSLLIKKKKKELEKNAFMAKKKKSKGSGNPVLDALSEMLSVMSPEES